MALPTLNAQALTWQGYGSDAKNLVSVQVCDFTTYSAYTFNPSGLYRQTGQILAGGFVVDNLLSKTPIMVTIGPIQETVPPYTKQAFQLGGSTAQVTVSGTQSKIFVTFFYGTYMGTTSGTNYYAAQIAAGLSVETGFISMFAGSAASIPVGYLLCDGTPVSRTSYSGLFSVIGTLYGTGDGSTTFNLPDFTGRVPIGAGAGAGLTNRPLGSKGGAESVTLTATQMPYHTHSVNDPGHSHAVNDPGHNHGFNDPGHTHTVSDGGHTHGVNDPGHTHNFQWNRNDNGAVSGSRTNALWDSASSPSQWTAYSQGEWTLSGRPNYYGGGELYRQLIVGTTTGVYLSGSGANVSIQARGTGAYLSAATTGVNLSAASTGLSLGYAGGSGGNTQPTPTVPPYVGVNYVIKT